MMGSEFAGRFHAGLMRNPLELQTKRIVMKPVWMLMLAVVSAGAITGCAGDSFLEQRTKSDRAEYGSELIPVPPPHVEPVNANPIGPGGVLIIDDKVMGTWKFTTPPTVTRVERKTADYDQFSLYNGRPAPTDTPFLVITTTRNRESIAAGDPATYKVAGQREYVMNGVIAQEWTGLTNTGQGFCEMVVRKPGAEGSTGDVCHAMAVVKNEDEQKLALGILGSIVWQPNR